MAVRETTQTHVLRRNAIRLREVLFQGITDMAPGAAIAASIPAGVAFAGGSLPLAVVFALVACLFCAVSIGLIYPVYLYRHDPHRVVEVGLVHLDPLEEYE